MPEIYYKKAAISDLSTCRYRISVNGDNKIIVLSLGVILSLVPGNVSISFTVAGKASASVKTFCTMVL